MPFGIRTTSPIDAKKNLLTAKPKLAYRSAITDARSSRAGIDKETTMNAAQAAKQAAKESKDGSTRFVVWVHDEGRDVYTAEQARIYAPLIHIEGAYLNGQQVAA